VKLSDTALRNVFEVGIIAVLNFREEAMKKGLIAGLGCLAVIIIILVIVGGVAYSTYNGLVKEWQTVESKWAQVENDYQRRADLIPNLVATVKGYAGHERETLEAVTASRAQVGSVKVTPDILNNQAEFQKYQQAQAGLSSALSRLMVVVERYPDLKANQNFLDLQNQLEGTENRITVSRMRFNEAAQFYNTKVMQFPGRIFAGMFGFDVKKYFQSAPGSDKAPVVDFGK
jgi:LemA protein